MEYIRPVLQSCGSMIIFNVDAKKSMHCIITLFNQNHCDDYGKSQPQKHLIQ